jgi:uncharacterized protein YceK
MIVVVLPIIAALLWAGCGSSASLRTVRQSGNSVNYKFESSKWVDRETDECRRIEVDVRPKAKLYTNAEAPPSRLTLIDTDCERPFSVEEARYVNDGGVFLSGNAMDRFRRRYTDLFQELYGYVSEVVRP